MGRKVRRKHYKTSSFKFMEFLFKDFFYFKMYGTLVEGLLIH